MITVVDDLGAAGADRLVDALGAVGEVAGDVVLCLSGGTSPDAVLEHLPGRIPAALRGRIQLTWTDERLVPYRGPWTSWDPAVNRRSAHERWLSRDPGAVGGEAPPWSGEGTPEAALAAWERRWAALGSRIDVLLLGFGPDGHLASLFPGHPALAAVGPAVLVFDAPKPPAARITLTLSALSTARRVVGLCTGPQKGAILRRALAGDESLPLGRYVPTAVEWVVDRAAAAALEGA